MLETPKHDEPVSGAPRPLPTPNRLQELLFDAARLGRVDVLPALIHVGANVGCIDAKGHTPLILASYHGHEEATAFLLDAGAVVDQGDLSRGNTALMGVAFKGYENISRLLLARGACPNARNYSGQTALMMAAMFGRSRIVEMLLDVGADISLTDAAGNSALSLAGDQRNIPLVGFLRSRWPAGRIT